MQLLARGAVCAFCLLDGEPKQVYGQGPTVHSYSENTVGAHAGPGAFVAQKAYSCPVGQIKKLI